MRSGVPGTEPGRCRGAGPAREPLREKKTCAFSRPGRGAAEGGATPEQVRAGEWEKGPCWLPCPGWAQNSDLGQMGWFPGVLILTSPKPQASLPGPLPLLYLLDAVQNGIRQPSLRFTFSLTLCAARVAQQILKPEEHVYIRVKRFLLSHRCLDLRKVPGFLQLFYSFDFEEFKMLFLWGLGCFLDTNAQGVVLRMLCEHKKRMFCPG
ncbi:uncharacterized protein LOC128806937 [Vidua macroura]|uniref:uncharacterized protein LOC128806937 n=1 Tax=Vidua macroura TaxID=187451 RepID=UPI0023A8FE3B|nr:uncharacterized protein LOC128806937 [Vidua macroura]